MITDFKWNENGTVQVWNSTDNVSCLSSKITKMLERVGRVQRRRNQSLGLIHWDRLFLASMHDSIIVQGSYSVEWLQGCVDTRQEFKTVIN